jgi:hypothetical protein
VHAPLAEVVAASLDEREDDLEGQRAAERGQVLLDELLLERARFERAFRR